MLLSLLPALVGLLLPPTQLQQDPELASCQSDLTAKEPSSPLLEVLRSQDLSKQTPCNMLTILGLTFIMCLHFSICKMNVMVVAPQRVMALGNDICVPPGTVLSMSWMPAQVVATLITGACVGPA